MRKTETKKDQMDEFKFQTKLFCRPCLEYEDTSCVHSNEQYNAPFDIFSTLSIKHSDILLAKLCCYNIQVTNTIRTRLFKGTDGGSFLESEVRILGNLACWL